MLLVQINAQNVVTTLPISATSAEDYLVRVLKDTCAYTATRLDLSGRVLEFDMHLNRLVTSHHELTGSHIDSCATRSRLETLVDTIRSLATIPSRLTIVLESDGIISIISEPIKDIPILDFGCQVEVITAKRLLPHVKQSAWAKERRLYEDQKLAGSNEMVLSDSEGHLFEGISSNLFVGRQNQAGEYYFETCPLDKVLPGTIQKMVLENFNERKIAVAFKPPLMSDLAQGKWKGAFLTSTSRLVLPIEVVIDRRGPDLETKYIVPKSDFILDLKNEIFKSIQ